MDTQARVSRGPQVRRDTARFNDAGMDTQKFDLNGDRVPDVWKVFVRSGGDAGADQQSHDNY